MCSIINILVLIPLLILILPHVAQAELSEEEIGAIMLGRKHPQSKKIISRISPADLKQLTIMLGKEKFVNAAAQNNSWEISRLMGVLGTKMREFDARDVEYDRDQIINVIIKKSDESDGFLTNVALLAFTGIDDPNVIEFAKKHRAHDEYYTRKNALKLYESLTGEHDKIRENRSKRRDASSKKKSSGNTRLLGSDRIEADTDYTNNSSASKWVYISLIVIITATAFWYLKRKTS